MFKLFKVLGHWTRFKTWVDRSSEIHHRLGGLCEDGIVTLDSSWFELLVYFSMPSRENGRETWLLFNQTISWCSSVCRFMSSM